LWTSHRRIVFGLVTETLRPLRPLSEKAMRECVLDIGDSDCTPPGYLSRAEVHRRSSAALVQAYVVEGAKSGRRVE
jgi:hypothetical protein